MSVSIRGSENFLNNAVPPTAFVSRWKILGEAGTKRGFPPSHIVRLAFFMRGISEENDFKFYTVFIGL